MKKFLYSKGMVKTWNQLSKETVYEKVMKYLKRWMIVITLLIDGAQQV